MTDRELLERAAKAAGIEFVPQEVKPGRAFFGLWLKINGEPYEGQRRRFNSLKDGEDALSLSVKLRINIEHGQYSVRAYTDDAAPIMVDETVFTPDESQRQFAMRDAITRAAAAIGSAHEALQFGDRG